MILLYFLDEDMSNDSLILRVAARFAATRPLKPEKLQEAMMKIRKGATASIKMPILIQVLDHIGKFKYEEKLVLEQEHGNIYTQKGDEPKRFGNVQENTARAEWQLAKNNEVSSLPSPGSLKEYASYYMDVTDLTHKSLEDGKEYWTFYAKVWQAVPGFSVTAPNGKTYTIAQSKERFTESYPEGSFMKWLKEEVKWLDLINEKLGLESYEVERQKAKTPPRVRDNTGTCPCCFGNYKLAKRTRHGKDKSMPGMILHGYKRPGTGYIHGNCFGQDWPPFELSPEGTKAYIEALERHLKGTELYLDRLNKGEIEVFDGPPGTNKVYRKAEMEDRYWQQALDNEIRRTEWDIKMMKSEIKDLEKKVSSWKVQPLPMTSPETGA